MQCDTYCTCVCTVIIRSTRGRSWSPRHRRRNTARACRRTGRTRARDTAGTRGRRSWPARGGTERTPLATTPAARSSLGSTRMPTTAPVAPPAPTAPDTRRRNLVRRSILNVCPGIRSNTPCYTFRSMSTRGLVRIARNTHTVGRGKFARAVPCTCPVQSADRICRTCDQRNFVSSRTEYRTRGTCTPSDRCSRLVAACTLGHLVLVAAICSTVGVPPDMCRSSQCGNNSISFARWQPRVCRCQTVCDTGGIRCKTDAVTPFLWTTTMVECQTVATG